MSFRNQLLLLILTSAFAGLVGFRMGQQQTPPAIVKEVITPQIPDELIAKFEQLGQNDINEYLILKDQKARYEKADEILGKILVIMLYDLGLRVSESQLQTLKSTVIEPPAIISTADIVAPPPPPPTAITTQETAVSNMKPKMKQNGRVLVNLIDDNDVQDFLKKNEMKDFSNQLQGALPLSQTQMNRLNGHYLGVVQFDDPATAPWQVEMRIQGRVVQGKYRGQHNIVLKKNGMQFSYSQGSFGENDYQTLADDSSAFLVRAFRNDTYFQLYSFPLRNELNGTVYQQSKGKFTRRGQVSLKKL